MNNQDNTSLFTKKVSVWHIIYILLITVVVNVFLFAICPGRINPEAFTNVSFAATIVSIVLALVSIIYTLQSGASSAGQLEGIKEIEGNIKAELTKFSNLHDTIEKAIDPVKNTMADIQKKTGDIQKAQDEMKKNVEGLFTPITLQVADDKDKSSKKDITLSHMMVVSLYAASRSKQTGMDMPYHIFSNFVGFQSHYAEGVLDAWAALHDDIEITQGSSSTRKKVSKFNEDVYGTSDELKAKASSHTNKRLGVDFISAIDCYFGDIKNQQSKDSIG